MCPHTCSRIVHIPLQFGLPEHSPSQVLIPLKECDPLFLNSHMHYTDEIGFYAVRKPSKQQCQIGDPSTQISPAPAWFDSLTLHAVMRNSTQTQPPPWEASNYTISSNSVCSLGPFSSLMIYQSYCFRSLETQEDQVLSKKLGMSRKHTLELL